MIKQLENQLRNVRNATKENSPLIHCITNPISIHGCANMILAVGARPMMAEHPLEVEDITRTAGALMLNLGNITDARMESMRRSARVAMECGIPILLDLVGVTCSRIRMELARELIGFGQIQILKGNISELLAIAGQSFHGTGIDAGKEDAMTDENEEERRRIFRTFSQQTGSVLLATGARDLLVDQERCLILENGTTKLSGITGTGCMVGALTAAYLAQKDPFIAAVLGISVMGIAGELAERSSKGPGSFQIELLDAVAGMRQEVLEAKLRIRETEA
ncbi:hydroxyethylthiazole kinase [Blautia faecicola]|uniref:Hydroxyethylthiazole kinase n=1 Tax=Blautia faecicola TaxID=2509240 RepID=A0A4Q1RGV9_9FIRM|nr:hydroxyethylthiazole kinase [Blautia faecicola]RGF11685.1 hydroxyethylthiazole kinase [Blautia sp. AM16-16B]RXS74873.1 hydroxyethylthiazole kinase [Blautia faecicola]